MTKNPKFHNFRKYIRFWVLLKILSIYIFPWFSIELRPRRAVTILVRFLWLVHRRTSRHVCSMPVDWERIADTEKFCVFQYSKHWFYFNCIRSTTALFMRLAENSCSSNTVLIVASKLSTNSSNFYNERRKFENFLILANLNLNKIALDLSLNVTGQSSSYSGKPTLGDTNAS